MHILDYLAAPTVSAEANFLTLSIDGWDNKMGSQGVKALTPTGTNEIGNLTNIASGPLVYYYPSEPPLAPVAQEYTRRLLAIGRDRVAEARSRDRVTRLPLAKGEG